jgi:hypothetical protein
MEGKAANEGPIFLNLLPAALDEGICPTNCPEGCIARAGRGFVRIISKISPFELGLI